MRTRSQYKQQTGQAYAEFVVGFVVIGLFLFGAYHVWRYAEARQALLGAARFAAWERTVWEPADNDVEKHALHRSDASVARETVLHQLSQPLAWRRERAGIGAEGTPASISPADRKGMLKPALQSFVEGTADANAMLTVTTASKRQAGEFVGRDPTFNTTTSLELDRDVYRTVTVTLRGQRQGEIRKLFGFALPDVEISKATSLLVNSWAASVPVSRIRITNQLMPLATGDPISGTDANFLAYFGSQNHLLGMMPWWNMVGGAYGFGGQYVVHKLGMDAGGANSLIQSHSWSYDSSKTVPENFLVKSQLERNEYFNPMAVSAAFPRYLVVQDKTQDAKSDVPRNSIMGGKRKYMGFSLQNPVENYFRP